MESIPQTHIMMTLLFIFNPDKMAELGGEDNNLVTKHTPLNGADLITLKFILSVLTSSFGIANFFIYVKHFLANDPNNLTNDLTTRT